MLDSAAFCSIWPGMQGEDCKQKVTKNEDSIREHLVSHSEKFCQFCPVPLFLIHLSAVDFFVWRDGCYPVLKSWDDTEVVPPS